MPASSDKRASRRSGTAPAAGALETERLALEWESLRSERQKAAMEFRLRRLELMSAASRSRSGKLKELVTNPLLLAILGGFITLMTTIITSSFNVSANLKVESAKAEAAAKAAKQALQADLIKKFVESPETETVRRNLEFLVIADLIPDYAPGIDRFLRTNAGAPKVSSGPATTAPQIPTGSVALINAAIGAIASSRLSQQARSSAASLLEGTSLIESVNWLNSSISRPEYRFAGRLRQVVLPRTAPGIDMKRDCDQGQCAIAGVEKYAQILSSKSAANAARAEALRMVLGLVADLHRPLHVSYQDDAGGNRLRVQLGERATTLHALWDTMPVTADRAQVERYATDLLARYDSDARAAVGSAPLKWAQEGLDITKQIYAELPSIANADPATILALDENYIAKNLPVVERQIVRAGVRIAELLNAALN